MPKASDKAPGESLFDGLHYDGRIPSLRFAEEEMHMLWHDDVSDDREAMSSADLLQEFEK